jgi:hypothetical protein
LPHPDSRQTESSISRRGGADSFTK